MIKVLFQDVKPMIARTLNVDIDDVRVLEYTNRATKWIMSRDAYQNMERHMQLLAYEGIVTLPPEATQIVRFHSNGRAGTVYSKMYEYLEFGPGTAEEHGITARNMVDLGEAPTLFDVDPDNPQQIQCTLDALEEEFPIRVHFRGLDAEGREVRSDNGSTVGEYLVFLDNSPVTSVAKFSKVLQITKPVTNGYLRVTSVDDSEVPQIFLSELKPWETTSAYRRYQLHGIPQKSTDGYTMIHALVRMGYAPIYNDSDPLLITDPTCLQLAVKVLLHYEAEETNKALTLESVIERQLVFENNQYEQNDNLIEYDDTDSWNDLNGAM